MAAGEPEPEAMALATVGSDGWPAVRFVLLKSWDRDGFVFFTNAGSGKGRDLADTGRAALALRWERLDRQVRVAGPAAPVDPAESDAYFASRARRSQLGAWASHQSSPLRSRRQLDDALAEAEVRFAGAPVPRPGHWHGWRVVPHSIELWQGRSNRLHDRWRYTAGAAGWTATRLSP